MAGPSSSGRRDPPASTPLATLGLPSVSCPFKAGAQQQLGMRGPRRGGKAPARPRVAGLLWPGLSGPRRTPAPRRALGRGAARVLTSPRARPPLLGRAGTRAPPRRLRGGTGRQPSARPSQDRGPRGQRPAGERRGTEGPGPVLEGSPSPELPHARSPARGPSPIQSRCLRPSAARACHGRQTQASPPGLHRGGLRARPHPFPKPWRRRALSRRGCRNPHPQQPALPACGAPPRSRRLELHEVT